MKTIGGSRQGFGPDPWREGNDWENQETTTIRVRGYLFHFRAGRGKRREEACAKEGSLYQRGIHQKTRGTRRFR